MGYREDTIGLLYKVLAKNFLDGRVYISAAESSKRLLFKNFFRKLAHQKRTFCKRIKYEIEVLENEILLMGGEIQTYPDWEDHHSPILPVFRAEKDGLIKECYRREKQNIEFYINLLSRISIGQIREMLLFQKHSIQLILNEIEAMGLKLYDGREEEMDEGTNFGGRNLGERSYS